ncbi:MAG TPA: MmcQ/YjbR family DNA-binding protein [Candidatus Acidoferrum sp.]|nr:MmcQ/YjbR family DNA-binding protein [Candidatus Acidoferrum sp.]
MSRLAATNDDVLSFRSREERIVTAEQFRRLALSFPEAFESSHMDHPDFRVRGGKIFATLAYPEKKWGMVKLTPEQQEEFVRAEPEVFEPVAGGWGRGGATSVRLRAATKKILKQAMAAAWCNAAPKRSAQEFEAKLK